MNKKIVFCVAVMSFSLSGIFAQNKSVSIGSLTPDNSAILDLEGITQGFLMTRLDSSQIKAIVNPANGLIVFNKQDQCFWYRMKTNWERICTTDSLSNKYFNSTNITADTAIINYLKVNYAKFDTVINTYISSKTTKTDSLYINGTPIQTLIQDSIISTAWLLHGNNGTNPPVNFLGTRDNKDLVFGTANTERLRVLAGGNVGIGTTAPLSNLEVLGITGIAANRYSADVSGAQIAFKKARGTPGAPSTLLQNDVIGQLSFMGYVFSPTPYLQTANISANVTDPAWTDLARGTNLTFSVTKNAASVPSEAMRIENNGNVGIGTIAPGAKLEVSGALNSEIVRISVPGGSPSPFSISYGNNLVGVNNAQGVVYFDVTGNETYVFGGDVVPDSNHSRNLGSTPNNFWKDLYVDDVFVNNCNKWLSSMTCSDIRYKKDITSLKNVLPDLLKLQGIKYNWRVGEFPNMHFNDKRDIGFIAQEMEKTFPEIVTTNKDGYKSIDYAKLTPVLVEAIKEQQKMIEDQRSAIIKLEANNNNQQSEIEKIKLENTRKFSQYEDRLKKLEELLTEEAKK